MNGEIDSELLLQQVLCGDLDEGDARVRNALDADPRLRERLATLRVAERDLAAIGADAAEIRAAARMDVSPGDRARVRAALAGARPVPQRRTVPWLLAAAAAALLALWLLVPSGSRGRDDGMLGGPSAVEIERAGDAIRVRIREQLPPGGSYHLRLEIPGSRALAAISDVPEWTFPPEWNHALASATSARLVVQWGDAGGLAVAHGVQLK
jgi:hypothetical protein